MNPFDRIEDPRRRLLVEALTLGYMAWGLPISAHAQIFGSRPAKLPPGQSIFKLGGAVSVNGAAANLKTQIRPGDTVETGSDGEISFVVSEQAILLRANSRLQIQGDKAVSTIRATGMRLVLGKILSVSRNQPMQVTTGTATMGIRGTGWYAEADPEQTYFCTCYGETEVSANNDPNSRETITAKHHDRPVYILAKAGGGNLIRNAPFINHTDQELSLLETLVGRTPPFVFAKDDYKGPRRDY